MVKGMVSIGIPTFNSELYVVDALDSIINQTYTDWELIISDNCSEDSTMQLIETWLETNSQYKSRIIIFKQSKNIGMVKNWNFLLNHFTGYYGKILCSDDRLHMNCLKLQVEALEKYPEVNLVSCCWKFISKSGRPLFKKKPFNDYGLILGETLILNSYKEISNPIGPPSAVLMRRSKSQPSFHAFNPDLRYYCDIDCWLRYLASGCAYLNVESLYEFRIHSYSETAKIKDLKKERKLFIQLLKERDPSLNKQRHSIFLGLALFLRDLIRAFIFKIVSFV